MSGFQFWLSSSSQNNTLRLFLRTRGDEILRNNRKEKKKINLFKIASAHLTLKFFWVLDSLPFCANAKISKIIGSWFKENFAERDFSNREKKRKEEIAGLLVNQADNLSLWRWERQNVPFIIVKQTFCPFQILSKTA